MLRRHSTKSLEYPAFSEGSEGVHVRVKVNPRSSKDQLLNLKTDLIRVRLTAPPVEGEANRALIQFIARACRAHKGDVEILSGKKSRQKTILIRGLALGQLVERLECFAKGNKKTS